MAWLYRDPRAAVGRVGARKSTQCEGSARARCPRRESVSTVALASRSRRDGVRSSMLPLFVAQSLPQPSPQRLTQQRLTGLARETGAIGVADGSPESASGVVSQPLGRAAPIRSSRDTSRSLTEAGLGAARVAGADGRASLARPPHRAKPPPAAGRAQPPRG